MNALVTGGTKGIGKEIVRNLLRNNIPTIFTGRNLDEIQNAELSFHSPIVRGLPLDFASMDSIQTFFQMVHGHHVQPNILIHNAGYLSLRPFEKPKNVSKLYQINSIGPLILTQHFLPKMMESNKGHILFNAPPLQFDDKVKYLTPYLQSKFAQTTYMKSLSYILKDYSITANTMWTAYPLWTDAISKRNIGRQEDCMDPAILARVVEEVIFSEDPRFFKGNELIDRDYLQGKGIPVEQYRLGENSGTLLDDLFLKKLTS